MLHWTGLHPHQTYSFIVLNVHKKLGDSLSKNGVNYLRGDLAKRNQDEIAILHLRMGNLEAFFL